MRKLFWLTRLYRSITVRAGLELSAINWKYVTFEKQWSNKFRNYKTVYFLSITTLFTLDIVNSKSVASSMDDHFCSLLMRGVY